MIIFSAVFLLITCSCESLDTSSKPITNPEQKNLYLTENGDENYIIIKLPNNDFGTKTNKFIEDYIASTIYEISGKRFDLIGTSVVPESKKPQDVEYYIEIESKATYVSDDTISITFSGMFNKKSAAHPTNLFFALNFDPNTMKMIDIADRYIVDSKLYNSFTKQAQKQLAEEFDDNYTKGAESFFRQFCSESAFLNGLKPEAEAPIYWHYSKSGIVFTYAVPHTLGDYKEVELSFDVLEYR